MINVNTPSLYDYYTDTDLRRLEALFLLDLESELESPEAFGFIADSYYDILIGLAISEQDKELLQAFAELTAATVEKNGIFYNGVELTESDVEEIRMTLLVATGRDKHDAKEDETVEDEFTRKMREAEERIRKIRGESIEINEKATISYQEMIQIIVYELGMNVTEIQKLNQYGLKVYYKLAENAAFDKITKIAAGNGLLKDKSYRGILDKK